MHVRFKRLLMVLAAGVVATLVVLALRSELANPRAAGKSPRDSGLVVSRLTGEDAQPLYHEDVAEVRTFIDGEWIVVYSRIHPESVGKVHHLQLEDDSIQVIEGVDERDLINAGDHASRAQLPPAPRLTTLVEKKDQSRKEMAQEALNSLQFRRAPVPQTVVQATSETQRPESEELSQLTPVTVEHSDKVANDTRKYKLTFTIKSYFTLPLHQFTKSDVLKGEWVRELEEYLHGLNSKQISIVTANSEHEVVLLNWLISALVVADPPLENVLMLSLSKPLTDLLESKNIPVIFVDPKTIITDSAAQLIRTSFSQVHIVRLTFFRLINHWGFDVVMYDADAIVLKNPQPLFEKYSGIELVGSAGKGPDNVYTVWGRTICTGVLLMRSSAQMEMFWEKMAKIAQHPFTDQGLVNYALRALQVEWKMDHRLSFNEDMQGTCTKTPLRAVIVSEEVICRYTCDERKRSQYLVWHKPAIKRERTVAKKMERAQDGHAWFLRKDWEMRKRFTGVEWLRDIAEL